MSAAATESPAVLVTTKSAKSKKMHKDLHAAAATAAGAGGALLDSNLQISSSAAALFTRSVCRYGPGCTHMLDPSHKEKFWHPPQPKLDDTEIALMHICNECGVTFPTLEELQLHLERKTAWSNKSLVGCKISCLVDHKEWHEGCVTQFHKSGQFSTTLVDGLMF